MPRIYNASANASATISYRLTNGHDLIRNFLALPIFRKQCDCLVSANAALFDHAPDDPVRLLASRPSRQSDITCVQGHMTALDTFRSQNPQCAKVLRQP